MSVDGGEVVVVPCSAEAEAVGDTWTRLDGLVVIVTDTAGW